MALVCMKRLQRACCSVIKVFGVQVQKLLTEFDRSLWCASGLGALYNFWLILCLRNFWGAMDY